MIRKDCAPSILVQPSRNSEKPKECRRRVSFSSMAQLCLLNTNEENIDPSELWWTSRDYKNIKRRCVSTARLLVSSDDMFSQAYNESRGLERLMDGGQCKELISKAVEAVRREQARHELDDVEDSDLILAKVYGSYCIVSTIQAERLGRLDAQEAMIALGSDWDSSSGSLCYSSDSESSSGSSTFGDDDDNINNGRTKHNDLAQSTLPSTNADSAKTPCSKINSRNTVNGKNGRRISSVRRNSLERIPFRENLRFSIINMMNRRRHAWI